MLLKNKFFLSRTTFLVLLFVFFILINMIRPQGDIKYAWHYGIWLPLTTYVVFWEGRAYLKIYRRLFKLIWNIDTLIGLSAHTLYLYSVVNWALHVNQPMYSYEVFWDGTGILILLTNIGNFVQDKISQSNLDLYNKLNKIKKMNVWIEQEDGLVAVLASQVKVGQTILLKTNERLPLDGFVVDHGEFDYADITGESKPIFHKKNDFVSSGSLNVGGDVKIRVAKSFTDSTLNRIVQSIENISASKPPMQQLADKILRYFIPGMMLLSVVVFFIWLALGLTNSVHLSWIDNGNPVGNAIKAGVTTIAIVCPCALGMATPFIYAVSSMLASKIGLLVNNPKSLEKVNQVSVIAFDKTGTLTSSEMSVVKVHGDRQYLKVAAGIEKASSHPIARAIANYSEAAKVSGVTVGSSAVQGIFAGKSYVMKTHEGSEFKTDPTNTSVALYEGDKALLVYELKNQIKKRVVETIQALHKLKMTTVMITGDKQEVAQSIAREVGIDSVYAQVTPTEKAEIIRGLQKQGPTAFVGDGFNDAVAVKQADLSFVFSDGNEVAGSLSDVLVLSDDFNRILLFLTIGKMNNVRVKISLIYAFAFNLLAVPIAALQLVQPWMGALIMALSALLVSVNTLLYKIEGERKMGLHKQKPVKNKNFHFKLLSFKSR